MRWQYTRQGIYAQQRLDHYTITTITEYYDPPLLISIDSNIHFPNYY